MHYQYLTGGGLSHRYGIRLVSFPKSELSPIRRSSEAVPVLEIIVNLQCHADVVEEVTPPMVHDQRT